MTDKTSWFAEPAEPSPSADPRGGAWSDRFRGAMLGGAVGDALGAGVRHRSAFEIQRWFGPNGIVDYLPVYGRGGAVTELTQLTVFTLEALLRAKAVNPDPTWLPTQVVGTNHLRWLYTQGVPWEFAMSAHLPTQPEPGGWLLERPELFSTRNPAGTALRGVGQLANQPLTAQNETSTPPLGVQNFADCIVWAAPTMVWNSSEELVFAAGAAISNLLTGDPNVHGATGLHGDILAQLIRGVRLWDAVSAAETQRLGKVYCQDQLPADVRRTVHAAMFTSHGGRPGPAELDVAFDTQGKPGELGIALASVACTETFADAVRMAVNQSADSSVTGALAGQLAGAVHGPDAIPAHWLEELELREIIEVLCGDAAEAFAPPPLPKWAQRYVDTKRHFAGPLELTAESTTVDSEAVGREQRPLPEPVPERENWAESSTEATIILPVTEPEREQPGEWEPAPMAPKEEWQPAPDPLAVSESLAVPESPAAPESLAVPEPVSEPPSGWESTPDPEPAYVPDFPVPSADPDPAEPAQAKQAAGEHAKIEVPEPVAPSLTDRVLGCFLGGALGNSLGSDIEFATSAEIAERFGPDGPRGLPEAFGVRGAITDDTQLTLFTAEGLIRGSIAEWRFGAEDPLREVQLAYQRWLHTQGVPWESAAGGFLAEHRSPDGWLVQVPELFGARAPGNTVYGALAGFGEGNPLGSFTQVLNESKGCGGVMRIAPVALYSEDPAEVFTLAARVAALTHSHPTGYHSAGALAVIIQQALLGHGLDDGVWLALQVLETWDEHEETSAMLKLAVDLASRGTPAPQHIEQNLGGGWVGEQALAIAVCAALAGGDDIELALRLAVHHSGDSDSTGSICGNIMGALNGVRALPADWLAELELREVIEQIGLDCVAEFGSQEQAADPARLDEGWNERYPVRAPWSAPNDSPTHRLPTLTASSEPEQPADRSAASVDAEAPVPVAVAEFPAPKPSPRRINGVMPADQDT